MAFYGERNPGQRMIKVQATESGYEVVQVGNEPVSPVFKLDPEDMPEPGQHDTSTPGPPGVQG